MYSRELVGTLKKTLKSTQKKMTKKVQISLFILVWLLDGRHVFVPLAPTSSSSSSSQFLLTSHNGSLTKNNDALAPPCGGDITRPAPPLADTWASNMATRWGICAAGKISHDFTVALKSLPPEEHQVSARSMRGHTPMCAANQRSSNSNNCFDVSRSRVQVVGEAARSVQSVVQCLLSSKCQKSDRNRV